MHPDHPVDTCQGAVNLLTGAEPLGALLARFGSEAAEEEEDEAVFIRGVNTNKDMPNAQLSPQEEEEEEKEEEEEEDFSLRAVWLRGGRNSHVFNCGSTVDV